MNRQQLYTLGAILFASMSLGACGTKPTDPATGPATSTAPAKTPNQVAADAFHNVCLGVPIADLAFSAVGVFNPTIIDADARRWESAAVAGLNNRCAGPPPTVETYEQVVKEIAADIKVIMDVVAAAKNNPPGG